MANYHSTDHKALHCEPLDWRRSDLNNYADIRRKTTELQKYKVSPISSLKKTNRRTFCLKVFKHYLKDTDKKLHLFLQNEIKFLL